MQPARLAFVTAVLSLVFAPSALAGHQFTDVPNGAPFHDEIGIFKGTNITSGCTATTFCPQEYVRRQAMAAFIDRALGLVIRPGESTQKGVPDSRVAMLDDDLSFVGTEGNALRYRGPDDNVVGGTSDNTVGDGVVRATIAGGTSNHVTFLYGSIGGGIGNQAGWVGTVPGGQSNTASGTNSFAAGTRARATHKGSFVWSGGSWYEGDTYTYSPADYSFSAHAAGGVNFWTTIASPTTGCFLAAGGGSWSCTSDRNAKENFHRVDGHAVLRRLARVPITSWNYKGQNDRFRHLGPTAQDFKAAFGVGERDKTISMVDADGVALAAIQALNARDGRLARENAALRRKNAAINSRLAEQQQRLESLERTVAQLPRANE